MTWEVGSERILGDLQILSAILFSIIVILIAGISIGSSTKKPPKEDETDRKISTEYEY
ncbi:MAG: hypothetical protein ACTSR9_08035 [Candidatus Thorarchaeota archaeon]